MFVAACRSSFFLRFLVEIQAIIFPFGLDFHHFLVQFAVDRGIPVRWPKWSKRRARRRRSGRSRPSRSGAFCCGPYRCWVQWGRIELPGSCWQSLRFHKFMVCLLLLGSVVLHREQTYGVLISQENMSGSLTAPGPKWCAESVHESLPKGLSLSSLLQKAALLVTFCICYIVNHFKAPNTFHPPKIDWRIGRCLSKWNDLFTNR